MSAPDIGDTGDEDGDDDPEAVSPEEALDVLPSEAELEAEFDD